MAAAGAHTLRNGGGAAWVVHTTGCDAQAAKRGARTKSKFRNAYRVRCIQWRLLLFSVHSLECLNEIHTLRTVATLSVALKGSTRLHLIHD
jgi:hypothetical protein